MRAKIVYFLLSEIMSTWEVLENVLRNASYFCTRLLEIVYRLQKCIAQTGQPRKRDYATIRPAQQICQLYITVSIAVTSDGGVKPCFSSNRAARKKSVLEGRRKVCGHRDPRPGRAHETEIQLARCSGAWSWDITGVRGPDLCVIKNILCLNP